MNETDLIELLLLQNRGLLDAPELLLFDAALVTAVLMEILRAGYLRTLGSVPATALYSNIHSGYIFSPAGRIRFYQLQRILGRPESDNPIGQPTGA